MKPNSAAMTLGLLLALAGVANAQSRDVVRPLGPITARTAEPVSANAIRPLPSGVLVNDATNRRLVLFDDKLASFIVVADTTVIWGGKTGSIRVVAGVPFSVLTGPLSRSRTRCRAAA